MDDNDGARVFAGHADMAPLVEAILVLRRRLNDIVRGLGRQDVRDAWSITITRFSSVLQALTSSELIEEHDVALVRRGVVGPEMVFRVQRFREQATETTGIRDAMMLADGARLLDSLRELPVVGPSAAAIAEFTQAVSSLLLSEDKMHEANVATLGTDPCAAVPDNGAGFDRPELETPN
jgi:hypothetical protein